MLPVLTAVCTGTEEAGIRHVLRDSAGVAIVENGQSDLALKQLWRIAEPPLLRVGGYDAPPDAQFGAVRGVARLSDGTVVVADAAAGTLLFFDSAGALRHVAGGRGEGPGEYRALAAIQRLPGDSLIAYDLVHRRLTLYSPSGEVAQATALDPPQAVRYVGRASDGRFVLGDPDALSLSSGQGVVRRLQGFYRYSADGHRRDTLATLPGFEFTVAPALSDPGRLAAHRLPFGRSVVATVGPDRWYVGANDRFEIQERTPEGGLARLIRFEAGNRALTAEEVRLVERQALAALPVQLPSAIEGVRRLFATTPATRPAYSAMFITPGDQLVVIDWQPATGADRADRRWWIFDRAGVLQGYAVAPASLNVYDVGDSWVLGVERDGQGAETVVLYAIQRSG